MRHGDEMTERTKMLLVTKAKIDYLIRAIEKDQAHNNFHDEYDHGYIEFDLLEQLKSLRSQYESNA